MAKKPCLTDKDRKLGVERLQYEARLAYLDGRNSRALMLSRKADALAHEIKKDA